MSKKYLEKWAHDLFPLNRSLAGKFNRQTLNYIKKNINNNFRIRKAKSGNKVFNWKIPKEYSINKGILSNEDGKVICDIKNNNLHVVVNSVSVNKWFNYNQLKKHIFFSNKMPRAIPYVTSYYKKNWGFCLSKKNFLKLDKKKIYKAEIKSNLISGNMDYAELLIKGHSKKEILISSYICHPSLANNELSGILAISMLSKILKKSKYSIRLLLIPETIGAINYINKNLVSLKKNLVAGFNLSCVGLSGPFTVISSIKENTYADRIVERIGKKYSNFKKKSFIERGSNERQFGCQKLNFPFVTICRKKFGEYKEYHTSADDLSILNYKAISDTVKFIKKIINEINNNTIYEKKTLCEPFLANKDLFDNVGTIENMSNRERRSISNFLAYVDKDHDLKSLEKKCKIRKIISVAKKLEKNRLIVKYI